MSQVQTMADSESCGHVLEAIGWSLFGFLRVCSKSGPHAWNNAQAQQHTNTGTHARTHTQPHTTTHTDQDRQRDTRAHTHTHTHRDKQNDSDFHSSWHFGCFPRYTGSVLAEQTTPEALEFVDDALEVANLSFPDQDSSRFGSILSLWKAFEWEPTQTRSVT